MTCDVDRKLIDRIAQTFSTTDTAHLAQADYAPERHRIQQYQGYLNELHHVLKNAKPMVTLASVAAKTRATQRIYLAQPDAQDATSNMMADIVSLPSRL